MSEHRNRNQGGSDGGANPLWGRNRNPEEPHCDPGTRPLAGKDEIPLNGLLRRMS